MLKKIVFKMRNYLSFLHVCEIYLFLLRLCNHLMFQNKALTFNVTRHWKRRKELICMQMGLKHDVWEDCNPAFKICFWHLCFNRQLKFNLSYDEKQISLSCFSILKRYRLYYRRGMWLEFCCAPMTLWW